MIKKKKRGHLLAIVIILLIVVGGFYLLNKRLTGNITLTGFAVQSYDNQSSFDSGTYSNTEYSTDHVKLSSGQSSGNYTSEIFDSSAQSIWNNISWVSSAIGNLPDDGSSESFGSGNADMTDIVLLAHLDESSENSGPGGSDFEDTSGNNYHGNESGGVTFNVSGKIGDGNAVSFDSVDDAINFGDIEMDGWRNFTVALWFKTSSSADQMRLASKDQVGVKGNWIIWHSSTLGWQFKAYEGSDIWAETSYNEDLSDDEWHHIAGKISIADDKIKLFVDGALVDEDDFPGSLIDTENEEVVLGADSDVASHEQLFDGEIDEFAIWNRELSADEIEDLYKRGITRLNLTARSCDDANCSGESFEDVTNNTSPQDLSLDNNQYFQYKFDFDTDNSSFSPELYNVTIDYENVNSAPVVSIVLPSDGLLYLTNESIELNYSATDTDGNLDSCWYNIDEGSNTTIASCANTTFDTSEGSHTLYLYANDTNGSESSDSVSFNVDPTGVSVTIVQPTGTQTSRTDIPFTYTTIGNNLTCWYEVKTSIGGSVISNTTLANCTNTTFTVSTDGDYVTYLYANNTLGSSGNDNSSFTVDSDSNGDTEDNNNGGGSSGGSSGVIEGTIIPAVSKGLEITEMSDLILRPGDSKKMVLSVTNSGTVFLNDCVVKGKKGASSESWINSESEGLKDLAGGEKHEFIFTLNVPSDIGIGKHPVEVVLECEEESKETLFNVDVLDQTIKFILIRVESDDENQMNIDYSLTDLSGKDQNLNIRFVVTDEKGNSIWEANEEKFLSASSTQEFELNPPISYTEKELKLLVDIESESTSFLVEKELVLSEGSHISGWFVWGSDSSDKIITWVFVALFIAFAAFMLFRIVRQKSE